MSEADFAAELGLEADPFFSEEGPKALIYQIAKLKLEPGDVLVVKATAPITAPQANALTSALAKWRSDNNLSFRVLVLPEWADIVQVRASDVRDDADTSARAGAEPEAGQPEHG